MNGQAIEFGSAMAKMAGGLIIVLIMVIGLAVLLKRLTNIAPKFGDGSLLTMHSLHRIGPKQAIGLLQVGKKAFLIGISQENITYLTEVALEDLQNNTKNAERTGTHEDKSFADKLRSIMHYATIKGKKEIEA